MLTKLFVFAVLLSAVVTVTAQEAQKKKTETEGRTITVTGCIEKNYLKVRASDAVGSYVERYRLRGSKQMLKELVEKYDQHVLEVTGGVTDLTRETVHRGKTIDVGKKTRITTGAKEVPTIPVAGLDATLEVSTFREMKDRCRTN